MTDTPRYWKPLVKLRADEMLLRIEVVQEAMKFYGIDEAAARKMLDDENAKTTYYVNDLYQCAVSSCGEDDKWLQINIRRRDGAWIRDSRHFQQIKNELAGPEREAIEIYPAESRWVDTSNKYSLWVIPEGMKIPVGWTKRDVQYEENKDVPGLRQRPL